MLEYMVYHDDQRCRNHEEYQRSIKELSKNSLGGIDIGEHKETPQHPKMATCTKRVTTSVKCSPIKEEDVNVMTAVSDGDDDVVYLHTHPSESTESYKTVSTSMTPRESTSLGGKSSGRGKSKVNTKATSITKRKPPQPVHSNFRKPFSPQVYSKHPSF